MAKTKLTPRGKYASAKNNQRDISSDKIDKATEAKIDVIPEIDTPLTTEKRTENLVESDPLQKFYMIRNETSKFKSFVLFRVFSILTEPLFF